MSAPLNLARRPFHNERLPTLVLAVGCVALVGITVRHALLARELLPGRSRDVAGRVRVLEQELASLRNEVAGLQGVAAPADSLKEWAAVKSLVDRRAFSWTGLFASLERTLPAGIRLVSIAPQAGAEGTELKLAAVGQSTGDALALLQALQSNPDFQGAFLDGWTEGREGVDIACTVRYVPPSAPGGRP